MAELVRKVCFSGVKVNILSYFVLRYSSVILIHKADTTSGNSTGLEARIELESECLLYYCSFKTWNIIKSLLPSSRKDSTLPDKLKIQNNTITDIKGYCRCV